MNFYNQVSDSHLEILEESYQGKTATLKKAEKCCDKIVRKIKAMSLDKMIDTDINNDRDVLELASLLKKEFGFNMCTLTFNNSTKINAYTIPARGIFTTLGGMPVFPVERNGKYYDEKHGYSCWVFVFEGVIKFMDLTGGELLAVILHEIGHNFETHIFAQLHKLAMGICAASIIGLPTAMMFDLVPIIAATIHNATITTLQQQFPGISKYMNLIKRLIDELESFTSIIPFAKMGRLILGLASHIDANPIETARNTIFGTSGEIFADSFAATYGYGPEMASVSFKFTKYSTNDTEVDKAISRIPVLGLIKDMNERTARGLIRIIDPHPDDDARILNNIKKLEKDLNDPSIPAKLKKDIKRDLAEMQKYYDKLDKVESYEETNQYFTFAIQYINKRLGGNLDIKNVILRSLPNAYA